MTTVIEKCNCHSYNGDFGKDKEVLLKPPGFWNSSKELISIDACISNVVQALWDAGVITRGSCCGHNERNPSVAIESRKQAKLAHTIIQLYDDKNRQWDVLCWVLKKVNTPKELARTYGVVE